MHDLLDFALPLQELYDGKRQVSFQDQQGLTHVSIWDVQGLLTVNFEGTLDWEEWVNRDLLPLGRSSFGYPELGMIHDMLAYGVAGVMDRVLVAVEGHPYALAGHSKGAGEALLAAGMMKAQGHPPVLVRAFEPPRVGTAKLANWLAGLDMILTQTYNTYGADLVTDVPSIPPWQHPTDLLRIAVPDTLNFVEKHKLPAVIAALQVHPAAAV